jgi:uncharacterized protein
MLRHLKGRRSWLWLALLLPMLGIALTLGWRRDAEPEATRTLGIDDPAWPALQWAELMPPDWDPMQRLRDRKLSQLGDGDPRAREILAQMQAAWSRAPTRPELDGRSVRLKGYVVPIEFGWGGMREFLLVPYAGACIHTPPPPANQIVHVVASGRVQGLRSMDVVWVSGRLHVQRLQTDVGASGYQLEASHVAPFR